MKKAIFLIAILVLPYIIVAQCVFSGKIDGYSFGKLHICEQFGEQSKIIETISTNANGEFLFNFTTQEIGLYRIYSDNNEYFDIIHNGENIAVVTNIRNLRSSMKVLESQENQQLYAYLSQVELTEYKLGILRELVRIYPEGAFLTQIEKELKAETAIKNTCLDKAIKQRTATFAQRYLSYFTDFKLNIADGLDKKMHFLQKHFPMNDLELLNSNAYHHFVITYIKKYEPTEYENAARELLTYLQSGNSEIYDKMLDYVLTGFETMERFEELYRLSSDFGKSCSEASANLKTKIKNFTDLRVGGKATDFEIETLAGEDISLSGMKSDYTLLIFWASWCETCKEEIPHIHQAKALFDRAKVDILAISLDEDKEKLHNFLTDKQINLKVACDYQGWDGKIVNDYAVYATPTMYIIDKNLNIVAKPIGAEKLFGEVERLIKY